MSFDQSLISQHDQDIFAPSWLASISGSQKLAKSFNPRDIEAVDVVKTCDKLRLALLQKSHHHQEGCGENYGKQCAVRDPNISFRTFANVWHGTLKIYEQQVNTLFRLSQDLVLRSSHYDIKSLDASKRKSSSTSHEVIKKRRFTITEGKENTFLSSNYSELLDDLDKLTQDTVENSIEESTNFLLSTKSRCTRPLAQLQIREITIREISATTYGKADYEDDDTGFGEATHDEISQFCNFSTENSQPENKIRPVKRKLVYGKEPLAKQRYSHDSTIEPVRNENISVDNGLFGTPHSFRCNSLERSISPANTIGTPTFTANETFIGTNYKENLISSAILLQQNSFEITSDNADKINKFLTTDVKEEFDDKHITNNEVMLTEKINSKVIIDECIKIEQCEIIEQMKRASDVKKVDKKMIFKKLKLKKTVTALELLTRFNRRAIKLTVSLKQKISLKPEQFKRDYLSLLSEILKTNYRDEWASEIFPKWQQINPTRIQSKSKRLNITPQSNAKHNAILNLLDENLNLAEIDGNNNSMQIINNQMPQNDCELNKESLNEVRPYTVMMKLLEIWRYSTKNEIDAIYFCNSAKHTIDKALTFYSLLNLYKDQFIDITKLPHSIEMDKILLGTATQHLINANNINSK